MHTVYVMSGIPGSGKSSYVKKYMPMAVVASADSYFERSGTYRFDAGKLGLAHHLCWQRFVQLVSRGYGEVVVDNTNLTWAECSRYVNKAMACGYRVVFVRMEADIKTASERNAHGVKLEQLERMASKKLEIPQEILVHPNFHFVRT